MTADELERLAADRLVESWQLRELKAALTLALRLMPDELLSQFAAEIRDKEVAA